MNKYEEVTSSCDSLIYAIIHKYFKGFDVEDLHQVGVIGVIKAYNNYQENRNVKFSTYAYKYIYGEMCAYVNNIRSIKINSDYYALYRKINEAKAYLEQKLMHSPTNMELAMFLEIDLNIIENVLLAMKPSDSLERVIYDDGKSLTLSDTICDKEDYYNIDKILLDEEIKKLSIEEQKIIYLRYFEDRSQSEVANILGTSQVQVSRGEKKVLKKIKDRTSVAA